MYRFIPILVFLILSTLVSAKKNEKSTQDDPNKPQPLLSGKSGSTIIGLPLGIPVMPPGIGPLFAIDALANQGPLGSIANQGPLGSIDKLGGKGKKSGA
jgi:hypothetical protein